MGMITSHQELISETTIQRREDLRRDRHLPPYILHVSRKYLATGFGTARILRIRRRQTTYRKSPHQSQEMSINVLLLVKLVIESSIQSIREKADLMPAEWKSPKCTIGIPQKRNRHLIQFFYPMEWHLFQQLDDAMMVVTTVSPPLLFSKERRFKELGKSEWLIRCIFRLPWRQVTTRSNFRFQVHGQFRNGSTISIMPACTG